MRRDQPISEVDNRITRAVFNVQPVCSKSLKKYVLSLVALVEDKIKQQLPQMFGLMFDGFSDWNVHYIALFATYTKGDTYHETLLACSPLLEENILTAEQHREYIIEQLEV